MNTPNPLLPQGSLNSQSKGKSNFRIAVFTILAIHVVLICGFLIQGCKREPAPVEPVATEPTNQPPDNFEPFTGNDTATNPFPTDTTTLPPYDPATASTGGISTTAAVTGGIPTVSTGAPVVPTNFNPIPSDPTDTGVPVTAVEPTTTGETTVHVVAKGDMLSKIAQKYKVSVRSIEEANPGVNPTKLQIGQKLNIPAGSAPAASTTTSTTSTASSESTSASDYTTYTVKSGDNLERIASRNKTTVRAIKSANSLKTDRINVGQKLKIPTSAQ